MKFSEFYALPAQRDYAIVLPSGHNFKVQGNRPANCDERDALIAAQPKKAIKVSPPKGEDVIVLEDGTILKESTPYAPAILAAACAADTKFTMGK